VLETINVEVACGNGIGYLLSSSPPQKTQGYSCFAADRAHAKDPTSPSCALPANTDMKAVAGNVLARLGTTCQVANLNWMGINAGDEYIEIACNGGNDYVLTGPMPGASTKPPAAMSCADAASRGITCKMSNSGPPPLTFDTFKNALAQYNVACDATNLRSIGKETDLKRHVLEFQCPQQDPEGLVAPVRLQDSKAPFETLSCAQAAAKYKIICQYVKP